MRSWSHVALLAFLSIKWLTTCVLADNVFCDDPELCSMTKRFLRFGRALDTEPYSRISRQFYRIGRGGYQPYQDKRFLRFGRSEQPDVDEYLRDVILQSEEPVYRKRRSADVSENAEQAHRVQRSAEPIAENENKELEKREPSEIEVDKKFMRFGRGDEEEEKRFMRFGKRFMRFGKRFMRFGRDPEKRFMRFGRSYGGEEDNDDDVFYNESDGDTDEEAVKRFMRFGKRFMRFGKDGQEKRFMRFGKRESRSAESSQAQS